MNEVIIKFTDKMNNDHFISGLNVFNDKYISKLKSENVYQLDDTDLDNYLIAMSEKIIESTNNISLQSLCVDGLNIVMLLANDKVLISDSIKLEEKTEQSFLKFQMMISSFILKKYNELLKDGNSFKHITLNKVLVNWLNEINIIIFLFKE